MNCKSWRCPVHRASWKHRWTVIVSRETAVNPVNKLLTLTCAGLASPAQLVMARQILMRAIRKEYGDFEYFSVLEFTSRTRLPHLHLLARGLYIPQSRLSDLWASATFSAGIRRSPIVWIEAPKSQQSASVYALSYAINSESKNQDIPASWHGRKISYSRSFFMAQTARQHWAAHLQELYGPRKESEWYPLAGRLETYLETADYRE
jgi:hypothetical protein